MISREVRRNAQKSKQWDGSYEGERAETLAARRRLWDARFKLARQRGSMRVSHESIYRHIARTLDRKLQRCPCRQKLHTL
ncbi:hypothetical protein [Azospirillum sp.]|uniref:hypothetical protein n=1 Tax=Azospirillum sp. TaxID=34012 RepID=UPI0026049653|nr:hypothetical protein [Azospirillum sp.]